MDRSQLGLASSRSSSRSCGEETPARSSPSTYRSVVIPATPHVKYKISPVAIAVLLILVLLASIAALAA